ncbi:MULTISPECIES: class I SAM-dependent methyltransferase [Sphingobium]|uniref:class I SAM-dependent methyltransferase n=1 Tax=Sphingobium TaxID=165695 RepID=UPI0015EB4AD3|nr:MULTISPECIES: methyltransferase domain-containing protein [Sphingobium]MCW2361367.1 tRNA (mo5U34)-methyltransferase [Sphingobium sp. B10D3B]MCW2401954.1 tRNA (mo5U34)-methyltransferase [Sphingobium sp. B10D7B]MCW2408933.1 tRNA (mo5U34)-methyltransferase [Sphingobium xanthum]
MSSLPRPDITWFHSFDFEDGETISGIKALDILRKEADLIFDEDLTGKSVLDIGAWDGFFSFEAERRGATRVVATDHFIWSGPGWANRSGFDYIHHRLNSRVEAIDADIVDLPGLNLGQFDIVLFLGVFYHLKDPYTGLETAAQMCGDHLIVETATALPREKLPAMRLYAPGELGNDTTNFWAPNIPALKLMLTSFGFGRTSFSALSSSRRHPLNARILPPNADATHRTIAHAWR